MGPLIILILVQHKSYLHLVELYFMRVLHRIVILVRPSKVSFVNQYHFNRQIVLQISDFIWFAVSISINFPFPLDSSIIGLHNLFLNNWYTFYYGYSGFDTLFLCTGVLSLITSHLRNGLKKNKKWPPKNQIFHYKKTQCKTDFYALNIGCPPPYRDL